MKTSYAVRIFVAVILFASIALSGYLFVQSRKGSTNNGQNQGQQIGQTLERQQQAQLQKEARLFAASKKVLEALASSDFAKLETLVSPDGLSLRHVPNLNLASSTLSKENVSEITTDKTLHFFGYTDGKGDEINMTVADYLKKYINTADYLAAPDTAVNKTLGSGNSQNSLLTDKGSRELVAFHYSGFNPQYEGMDWTTMYLVFDEVDGVFLLRAIAKDNWTI